MLFPCCNFVVFSMCYLFNDSSRTGTGVTASYAPVSACDLSVWLPIPNPFSETQVRALKLCLQWSDSCLKSVSFSGENHFLVLNRTWRRKPLPCSRYQWWSALVDVDTVCVLLQSILVGSLMPVSFIFSLLQLSVFSENYGLLLVFYSWCFGIFLISLLQLIFVVSYCLILLTFVRVELSNTFYPTCNVDPIRPSVFCKLQLPLNHKAKPVCITC